MNFILKILKFLFNRLIPKYLRDDIVQYSYAKTLIGVGIAASISVPFFSLFYYFIGFPLLAGLISIIGLLIFLSLVITRATGNIRVSRELITCSLTALFTFIAIELGGILSPSAYWLVLPPIISLLIGGFISSIIWFLINSIIILSLYYFISMEQAIQAIHKPYFLPLFCVSIIGLLFVMLIFISISEKEKKRGLTLRFRAYHDSLTGSYNRYCFEDKLREMLKKKAPFYLISIDIDNFGSINETLGFAAGDHVLKQLFQRLSAFFPANSIIARTGSDEFFIIHFNLKKPDDLLPLLRIPYTFNKHGEIIATCSMGVASYPKDTRNFTKLIRYSTIALEKDKDLGGNSIVYFNKNMAKDEDYHLAIKHHLPHALKNTELFLHYQPKFLVNSKPEIVGMEVLLRWDNPKLGQVAPEFFIPIAEKLGLIFEIGDWVLLTALNQFKKWEDRTMLQDNNTIAINFSVLQMHRENAFEIIALALESSGVPPRRLEIEITESSLIRNRDHVIKVLSKLKDLGVSIALDDFGTGYSGFSYLQNIPLTSLKIDKSFIDNIKNGKLIISAIIKLAHNLGLTVIAEGVETKEQFDFLHQNKCDCIQGYYLSKPVSVLEMEKLLLRQLK